MAGREQIRDGAPGEWEYTVFFTRAKVGTHEEARRRLEEVHNEKLTSQAIGDVIQKLEGWYAAGPLFEGRGRTSRLTETGTLCLRHAETVLAVYEQVRSERSSTRSPVPVLAHLPHHLHYVARLESVMRKDGAELETFPLRQRHRGDAAFVQHALVPLRHGVYQLVVGHPASSDFPDLQSDVLYSARLEAKVDQSYAGDFMPLTELPHYRLMAPPLELRSRKLLEQAVIDHGLGALQIAAESYETATHILRMRADRLAHGHDDRVVVVPSDVALVFKEGYEFGGTGGQYFKWVPIMHNHVPLTHDVCVTTLKQRTPFIRDVVTELKKVCAQLPGLAGAGEKSPPA
ncbi:hypothetical protein OG607_05715 [Streptomyces sp. NBC_01537]|uniref:hypothetical protein n=1 Tax=Streptomyces sp. NBC_01537 TaxID=2903896 RepID=UPI003868265D